MPLDAKDIKIARLRGALTEAPRPRPGYDADWMVRYMDWFFQTRISTLEETGRADGQCVSPEEK